MEAQPIKQKGWVNKFIIGTFVSLYFLVSIISTIHVIDFFALSNPYWLAVSLAIGFELGAAASLASLITLEKMNKTIVWSLFITITLMQMQGNMYYAFQNLADYDGWVELFDLVEDDVNTQKRILAFVSGAILPLVALGFIKSLVDYIKPEQESSKKEEEEPSEYEKALQDFKGEEAIDTEEMIKKNEEMLATSSLPDEARGFEPPIENTEEETLSDEEVNKKSLIQQALKKESNKGSVNEGYDLTEEEVTEYYEREGWRLPFNGKPYYTHPRFDWGKRERWVNDRAAINYWLNKKGGSPQELNEIKSQYPEDFTKKTY